MHIKEVPLIIGISVGVLAIEPNHIKLTTYNVDGPATGNHVVTTEYSDGLGRSIQSKLRLSTTKDRVTCAYYDGAGRPILATKPFVDTEKEGTYLPGGVNDGSAVETQLQNSYSGETKAYSKNSYWNDPLNRIKKTNVPGAANSAIYSRTWVFGVNLTQNLADMEVKNGETTVGTVTFKGGVITSIDDVENKEELFDCLSNHFLVSNPFTNPDCFLHVLLDPEKKIVQQISDIFGREIKTYSDPDVGDVTGLKIVTTKQFDITGNVVAEIPPKKGSTVLADNTLYRYNTRGQMIFKKNPDIDGEYHYTYTMHGILESIEFGKNDDDEFIPLLRYRYDRDIMGRVVSVIEDVVGKTSRYVLRNYYDDVDNIPKEIITKLSTSTRAKMKNCRGRLVCTVATNFMRAGTKKVNVYQFVHYDDEGCLRNRTTVIDEVLLYEESWYEYDKHGKITAEYFFSGFETIKKKNEYDKLGRLSKIVSVRMRADGSVIDEKVLVQYSYNNVGIMEQKKISPIASNYTIGYSYDIMDRLTAIEKPADESRRGFSEIISEYYNSGNIRKSNYKYALATDGSFDEYDLTYTYDNLYRLTGAIPADVAMQEHYSTTYDYDNLGRFKTKDEGNSVHDNYAYYLKNSRLKSTSRNSGPGQGYIYDRRGNLIADFTKNMIIEYDWRNLPVVYAFYNNLVPAAIAANNKGTYIDNDDYEDDLYAYMRSKTGDGTVVLLSTVMMAYDADGNRVCTSEMKE